MAIKKLFISFAMVGLFVFAMMSFIVTTQQNNEMDETILSNPTLNKSYFNVNDSISDYKKDGQEQSLLQDEDDPLTEGGNLLFTSITGTGKIVKGMVGGVYNALIGIPSKLLGLPAVVVSVFTGILAIMLLLGAWRLYKAGE